MLVLLHLSPALLERGAHERSGVNGGNSVGLLHQAVIQPPQGRVLIWETGMGTDRERENE